MAKRNRWVGMPQKTRSHKTKKRLDVKHKMLKARKSKRVSKTKRRQTV